MVYQRCNQSLVRKTTVMSNAKSLGGALAMGIPVIFQSDKGIEVVCEHGKEAEALDTMEKMGIIKIMRPVLLTPKNLEKNHE